MSSFWYNETMKNYQSKAWLIEHYIHKGLSCQDCARASGYPITGGAIYYWLKKHGIRTRDIGEHMKGPNNPFLGKKLNEETRAKISRALTGKRRSLESRRKQSKTVKGKNNHRFGKPRTHGKGTWVQTPDGKLYYMRSSWEILYAEWLCRQGKQWVYEPHTFILNDGSAYTPDFLVDGIYYEVKGFIHERARSKIALFRKTHPDVELIVLLKEDLARLGIPIDTRNIVLAHLRILDGRIRTCPTCKQDFVASRKSSRFCSKSCSSRRPKKGQSFIECKVCHRRVKVYPHQERTRKVCSRKCALVIARAARHQ
jgi:hypothetical protein